MDTSVPDIQFDEQGVCNYCKYYAERIANELYYDAAGQARLDAIIAEIKRRGARREYDCIIGVSGGVDSSYVAFLTKVKFGLRPLAIHLDNGWDSELAVSNVEKLLRQLGIDLSTHVLDWEEFKDLQVAFLRASIANAEIPTDQAIMAVLFQTAATRSIPYIITGNNLATEAIMPRSWMYTFNDTRLIRSIQNRFGKRKLKTYPLLGIAGYINYVLVKGIKYFPILNYVAYNKMEAKQFLQSELGWRDYGGKHYESIYTRFFQSYLLPRKFNIDKRRAHLSNLILAGQITREQALAEMSAPPISPEQEEVDGEYVMKKLDLNYAEFRDIMSAPIKQPADYPNDSFWWQTLAPMVQFARRQALYNTRSGMPDRSSNYGRNR
jgi:N-acetyl sugar amidotransferase